MRAGLTGKHLVWELAIYITLAFAAATSLFSGTARRGLRITQAHEGLFAISTQCVGLAYNVEALLLLSGLDENWLGRRTGKCQALMRPRALVQEP